MKRAEPCELIPASQASLLKDTDDFLGVDENLFRLLTQHSNDEFTEKSLRYRDWAILSFSQSFRSGKVLFRSPKGLKKILDAEVKIWKSILSCIERLITVGTWNFPPLKTLSAIISEGVLVLLPLVFISEGEEATATAVLRKYQSQNKCLMDVDNYGRSRNPFRAGSVTAYFIDCAIRYAFDDPSFSKELYLPMIRARSEFVTVAKRENFILQEKSGKILTQGRKKLLVA